MTEVFIPTPAAGTKMAWTKLKDRQVYDFAVVVGGGGVHARRRELEGRPRHPGRRGAVPYRAQVVEDALKGKDVKATVKAGRGADPHGRPPDEPQRLQSRHRPGPDRANGPPGARLAAHKGRRPPVRQAPLTSDRHRAEELAPCSSGSGAWPSWAGSRARKSRSPAGPILQVTADGTSSVRPSWSPDGTRIAFQTSQDNAYHVYTMAADGSDRQADQPGRRRRSPPGRGVRMARCWPSIPAPS